MAVRMSTPTVSPPLVRRNDPALTLDGSSAIEQMPMVPSRLGGECRRNAYNFGAQRGQHSIQLRKPQIVADAEPQGRTSNGRYGRSIAGRGTR